MNQKKNRRNLSWKLHKRVQNRNNWKNKRQKFKKLRWVNQKLKHFLKRPFPKYKAIQTKSVGFKSKNSR